MPGVTINLVARARTPLSRNMLLFSPARVGIYEEILIASSLLRLVRDIHESFERGIES